MLGMSCARLRPMLHFRSRAILLALLGIGWWTAASASPQEFSPKSRQAHIDVSKVDFSNENPSAELPVGSRPPLLPVVVQPTARSRAPHAFWDRTNRMLFTGVGLFRGLDYASSRNMQARGREEVLLPDDVVNNSPGFAGLEAAATATSVGLSYLMHRTGHHSLERWVSIVHIGVTGFGVVRNYSLESKHFSVQR